MNGFTVVTRHHPDRTVITVRGDIDLETCPELTRAAAVAPLGGNSLCLDLADVPFMDSSGLNLLILLRQRLDAEGGRLTVTGLQPQPTRLLELTHTYDLLAADTTTAAGSDDGPTA
ncbi:STAS domain-containing protein [Streptomyces sp. NPDC015220]|uniref:STAS domain-containing protein n=1 Tax=Streptomyces sp. NPDC015220 TaxID=3364947 RepID=UPI0036FC6258